MQVFELLSALSVYSEEGHGLALDALNHYKVRTSCSLVFVFNLCFFRKTVPRLTVLVNSFKN